MHCSYEVDPDDFCLSPVHDNYIKDDDTCSNIEDCATAGQVTRNFQTKFSCSAKNLQPECIFTKDSSCATIGGFETNCGNSIDGTPVCIAADGVYTIGQGEVIGFGAVSTTLCQLTLTGTVESAAVQQAFNNQCSGKTYSGSDEWTFPPVLQWYFTNSGGTDVTLTLSSCDIPH